MFISVFPNILAIVFLSGLFVEFIPVQKISEFLGKGPVVDGLTGALFGSISTGNPLISYVLGGELLERGFSLIAVTAFIVSWVTVGSIQLPAEIITFGRRFALVRNIVSFFCAILIAILTMVTLRWIGF